MLLGVAPLLVLGGLVVLLLGGGEFTAARVAARLSLVV